MPEDKEVKAIAKTPGVYALTATASVATMGDAKSSSRAKNWLGGEMTLLACSRSARISTLLIHSARACYVRRKRLTRGEQIGKGRPP
jgi:transposase